MTIKRTLTHLHHMSIPLPELMEFITTSKTLLNFPSNARLNGVVDDDDAGHQVVSFSWGTEEIINDID